MSAVNEQPASIAPVVPAPPPPPLPPAAEQQPETKRVRTGQDLPDSEKIRLFEIYKEREAMRVGKELANNQLVINKVSEQFPNLFKAGSADDIKNLSLKYVENPLVGSEHVVAVDVAARTGEELIRLNEKYTNLLKMSEERKTTSVAQPVAPPPPGTLDDKTNRMQDSKGFEAVQEMMLSIIGDDKKTKSTFPSKVLSAQEATDLFNSKQ